MIRYGSVAKAMRPMAPDDLLISRLKLLIIMAKASLQGYPLGNFRKNAVTRNARYIFYNARMGTSAAKAHFPTPAASISKPMKPNDIYFLQRVQLLAVMLNAAALSKSKGRFRKKATAANIDHLCDNLADRFQLSDAKFLKVA